MSRASDKRAAAEKAAALARIRGARARRERDMNCPKCRRKQYYQCGNPDCRDKDIPANAKPQVHLPPDGLACPYCGFSAHADYWEDREYRELDALRRRSEVRLALRVLLGRP